MASVKTVTSKGAMSPAEKIKWLNDYIALHPSSPAFAQLAEAHGQAGELDKALRLLEHGLKQHPNYVPAHILRARYLLKKNQPFKAEEILREVLSIDPANLTALRILLELEVHREAATRGVTARKIAALDANDPLAIKILTEKTKTSSPFTTRSVAELYESQGYLTEALRIYRELAQANPDNEQIPIKIKELEGRINGT